LAACYYASAATVSVAATAEESDNTFDDDVCFRSYPSLLLIPVIAAAIIIAANVIGAVATPFINPIT
jgi:hypothetical protein